MAIVDIVFVTAAESLSHLVRTGVLEELPCAVDTAPWGLHVAAERRFRVGIEMRAIIFFGELGPLAGGG